MTVELPLRVAIQGERGSFSHQAALDALGADISLVERPCFDGLFDAVRDGAADRAVVPIENSLVGAIHENYDRLGATPLQIVAEHKLRIEQCLIARPGAAVASLRRVASHPVALAQCRNFFTKHESIEAVAAYDTAGSVRALSRDGLVTQGAIASRLAAGIYGGAVLQAGIEDDPENYTRFLILGRDAAPEATASKASLVFNVDHTPGALHRALGAFAVRGVSLTKIESRPLRGKPWEYAFYVDVLGEPDGAAAEAVDELDGLVRDLRVLGWYPSHAH